MAVAGVRVVPLGPLELPARTGRLVEGDRVTSVRRLLHVGDDPGLRVQRRPR